MIDAIGRRLPIDTGWDGEEIELVVPDAWLDEAVFPGRHRPAARAADALGAYHATGLDLVYLTGTTVMPFLITATRSFGNDDDAFVMRTDRDFGGGRYMFTEISASIDSRVLDATYVAGARRWLIAGIAVAVSPLSSSSTHTIATTSVSAPATCRTCHCPRSRSRRRSAVSAARARARCWRAG